MKQPLSINGEGCFLVSFYLTLGDYLILQLLP